MASNDDNDGDDGIINAIDMYNDLKCSNCGEKDECRTKLLRCGACVKHTNPDPAVYCSKSCQRAHWPLHKGQCKIIPDEVLAARERNVNDGGVDWCESWRKTQDGGYHYGDLELITWEGYLEGDETDEEELRGWGGTLVAESDDLKKKFEMEFAGDKLKLLKHHDMAFRWTCCGLNAAMATAGCDHHGANGDHTRARKPCGCDFCHMGEPLPDHLIEERKRTQAAKGLIDQLSNGPDPRSFDPVQASIAVMMRGIYGMDV